MGVHLCNICNWTCYILYCRQGNKKTASILTAHFTFNLAVKTFELFDNFQVPLAPVQEKSAKQTIRTVQKYEYPLVFDNEK